MNSHKEQKFFIYAICSVLFFLLITHCFVPVTYAVNDDVIMRTIASGEATGNPDGHLIYVQYVIGAILAFLYRVYRDIDWYGCFMLGVILFCTLLFLWRSKKVFKNNILLGIAAVLAIFSVAIFENIVNFQFTVVSGIAAATAIFYYNTIDTKGKSYYWDYLIVILLAWISYSIRANVFMMALPFAGITFLFKEGKWKEKLIFCVILFSGIIAITLVEKEAYASEDWKDYQSFNEYGTVPLYDYYGIPNYSENKDFYMSIGMGEHDVKNLEEYNLYFVEKIDEGKMEQIGQYAQTLWKQQPLSERIVTGIKMTIKGCFGTRAVLLNLLAKCILIANLWFEIKNRKKAVWQSLAIFMFQMILALYLGYKGRMVVRVITSLFLIEFFSQFSIWYREHRDLPQKLLEKKNIKILFAGMICLTLFMTAEVCQNQQIKYQRNLEWETLQAFCRDNPENVYFTNTYYVVRYTDNFQVFRKSYLKNCSRLGEWTTFSPVDNAEMKRYGIDKVDKAFIEQENVYLIFESPASWVDAHYLGEYGSIQWIEVDQAPMGQGYMPVYKLQAKER